MPALECERASVRRASVLQRRKLLVIEVRSLTKRYGGRTVVNDLSVLAGYVAITLVAGAIRMVRREP
jgi:hypothetical protein